MRDIMTERTREPESGSSELTRRSFLGMAGALPLACLAAQQLGAAARRIPIAVQMYSVRRDCQANFDAALAPLPFCTYSTGVTSRYAAEV